MTEYQTGNVELGLTDLANETRPVLDWVAEHPVDRIDKFLSWNVAGDMGWPRLAQGRYNQTKTPANEAFIRLTPTARIRRMLHDVCRYRVAEDEPRICPEFVCVKA